MFFQFAFHDQFIIWGRFILTQSEVSRWWSYSYLIREIKTSALNCCNVFTIRQTWWVQSLFKSWYFLSISIHLYRWKSINEKGFDEIAFQTSIKTNERTKGRFQLFYYLFISTINILFGSLETVLLHLLLLRKNCFGRCGQKRIFKNHFQMHLRIFWSD